MTKKSRKKIIPDETHKPQYLAPHQFSSNTAPPAAISKQHKKSSAQWVQNCPATEHKTFRHLCKFCHEPIFHNISTATVIISATFVQMFPNSIFSHMYQSFGAINCFHIQTTMNTEVANSSLNIVVAPCILKIH
jgi:hypothetical protein